MEAGERYTEREVKRRRRPRQSGEEEGRRGVSVEGNMRTLACMNDRSGRPEITRRASSLRFSSFCTGFLLREIRPVRERSHQRETFKTEITSERKRSDRIDIDQTDQRMLSDRIDRSDRIEIRQNRQIRERYQTE